MDQLEVQALRLLADVPENVCVFCHHDIRDTESRHFEFTVVKKSFLACRQCVENATDLRDCDVLGNDIRDEYIQAQTLECYVCKRSGATVICPNSAQCGRKFHWPCRRDEGDGNDGDNYTRCSRCADNVRGL